MCSHTNNHVSTLIVDLKVAMVEIADVDDGYVLIADEDVLDHACDEGGDDGEDFGDSQP